MTSEFATGSPQQEAQQQHRAAPSSTNLPLVEEHSASEEVRALFSQYRETFGRNDLPGIVLCFATHAPLLRGMLEIAAGLLFVDGHLTRRQKEMIATFVSVQNVCPYCADSHSYLFRAEGGSTELLCALRSAETDSPQFTPAEQELLRLCSRVNSISHSISPADMECARKAGWNEAQIAEAVHITALFAAFNRIANAFGLASPYPNGLEGQP
jgi:uncharacterized peroxidase-related enzyme